jgi:hypothetical protein
MCNEDEPEYVEPDDERLGDDGDYYLDEIDEGPPEPRCVYCDKKYPEHGNVCTKCLEEDAEGNA